MTRLTKDALLTANDLTEKDVELPTIGGSVRIRSLSAFFSSEATSEALEMTTDNRGEQKAKIQSGKLNAIKVRHGLIDPKLDSIDEAQRFLSQCGIAANTLVDAIDEISGLSDEDIKANEARFPDSGGSKKVSESGASKPAAGGS